MICFPNSKINLGLNILRKRPDNYHEIQSVFYPVPLYDALEINHGKSTSLKIHGAEIKGDLKSNLVYKAWELLHTKHQIDPVQIDLLKKIPSGGGLGGGSADGAFMLKLLNDFFELKLDNNTLENYSALLGSDCPFFIRNKPALVTGRGEYVEPIEMDLSGLQLVLVNPNIHISTGRAFQLISPSPRAGYSKNEIESLALNDFQEYFENDFEPPILKKHKSLQTIKENLQKNGAFFTSLSGSGSTYFALFEYVPNNLTDSFPNCALWSVTL